MDKEKIKDLLEKQLVLLEDDEDDTTDDDTADDADTDDEDESIPELDVSTKSDIRIIKNTIDILIRLNMFLISTYDSSFYEINNLIYKIRYSFIVFIKNFNSYEPKEQKQIIIAFKKTLQQIIQEIIKNL